MIMHLLLLLHGAFLTSRHETRFRNRRRQDFERILSDVEFIRHFRLNKSGFRLVCDDLRKLGKGTKLYPVEIKVLLTLSFLATGSYQKIIGLSHNIPQKTVSRLMKQVVGALSCDKMLQKWVKFPTTAQERANIKAKFQRKFLLLGVIGCVDGTHINIVRVLTVHYGVNRIVFKMGLVEDPKCRFCSECEESMEHLLCKLFLMKFSRTEEECGNNNNFPILSSSFN